MALTEFWTTHAGFCNYPQQVAHGLEYYQYTFPCLLLSMLLSESGIIVERTAQACESRSMRELEWCFKVLGMTPHCSATGTLSCCISCTWCSSSNPRSSTSCKSTCTCTCGASTCTCTCGTGTCTCGTCTRTSICCTSNPHQYLLHQHPCQSQHHQLLKQRVDLEKCWRLRLEGLQSDQISMLYRTIPAQQADRPRFLSAGGHCVEVLVRAAPWQVIESMIGCFSVSLQLWVGRYQFGMIRIVHVLQHHATPNSIIFWGTLLGAKTIGFEESTTLEVRIP